MGLPSCYHHGWLSHDRKPVYQLLSIKSPEAVGENAVTVLWALSEHDPSIKNRLALCHVATALL